MPKKDQYKYVKASIDRRRAWVEGFKVGKPCTLCGKTYAPVAMDFHHRDPSTKVFTISWEPLGVAKFN